MLARMGVTAVVWHFWIAPFVVAMAFGAVLALAIGYSRKVVAPQYPRSEGSGE